MVKADSNVALDQLIAGIQSLAGQEGDLEVFYDANSVMLCRDWIVDEVSTPRLLSGYGGRLCEELTITAVGSRPPLY